MRHKNVLVVIISVWRCQHGSIGTRHYNLLGLKRIDQSKVRKKQIIKLIIDIHHCKFDSFSIRSSGWSNGLP